MTTTSATERALTFDCEGRPLVGILHEPAAPAPIGVVIIVGGPQYRAGSHRQFVWLARVMAQAGFAVLRFDHRGMGDSASEARSFESLNQDVAAAIAALQGSVPAVRRIVLWGLCDGASAALLYLDRLRDPRVDGLCLVNPWVRSGATLARTQIRHYYTRRLRERAFWLKLLSGRIGSEAWRALAANLRARRAAPGPTQTSFQQRMARAWEGFGGSILLLLSEDDYTAKEFVDLVREDGAWAGPMRHPRLQRHDVPGADHTFSDRALMSKVNELTVQWLLALTTRAPSRFKELA